MQIIQVSCLYETYMLFEKYLFGIKKKKFVTFDIEHRTSLVSKGMYSSGFRDHWIELKIEAMIARGEIHRNLPVVNRL